VPKVQPGVMELLVPLVLLAQQVPKEQLAQQDY
jgi:hypothetical protein